MNETWWVADGQLDEDQRRVVSLPLDESQLIVGPPGSGKTNLLVLRAKYLTLAKRPNFQIVVFTRALREFIAAGADAYNVPSEKIVTSHKFFRDLLFQYGVSVAESENFSEQRRLLVEGVSKVVHKDKLQISMTQLSLMKRMTICRRKWSCLLNWVVLCLLLPINARKSTAERSRSRY